MKKAVTVLLIASLLLGGPGTLSMPSKTHASGLDEALNWLFMSATTEPRAYESQRRMGFVGGAVMARTPIRSLNIISFAPPRLDAGCGGIDLFLGSFSFINMDQFVQFLRAIAANAVGLAFKAALNAISPQLEAIISKLETLVNNMNRTFRNSCEVTKNMGAMLSGVGSLWDSVKQAASDVGNLFKTSGNVRDDFFSSVKDQFSNPNNVYESDSKPDLNPSVGNLVWKAFMLNNTAAAIGNAESPLPPGWSGDAKKMAQYVMSITGTVINMIDEDYDPSQCEGGDAGSDRCGVVVREYGAILRFRDLLDGATGGNQPQYYKCNTDASEMGCTKLIPVAFDFQGTRAYVSEMLFGTADGYLNGTYTGDSIVGRAINGGELTSAQKYFLNTIPQPIYSAMLNVQNDPAAILVVAQHTAPMIAELMAVSIGHAIIKAAQASFAGQYKVDKPASFDANLRDFMRDMNAVAQGVSGERMMNSVILLAQYVQAIRPYWMEP